MQDTIYLIANGDLRLAANRQCWAAQQEAEQAIMQAIRREGRTIERAHPYDAVERRSTDGLGSASSKIHRISQQK